MEDRLKHAKFVSTILNASLKEKVKSRVVPDIGFHPPKKLELARKTF